MARPQRRKQREDGHSLHQALPTKAAFSRVHDQSRAGGPLRDPIPPDTLDLSRTNKRKGLSKKGALQEPSPSKKPRSGGAVHKPSNFPPSFYDNLSKLRLTPRALRELDRRNKHCPQQRSRSTAAPSRPSRNSKAFALARLSATTGGPDLRDLRGYPSPESSAMLSRVSSSGQWTGSTKPTTATSKSKRSSAYDANFGQHCEDNHIYPPVYQFFDGTKPPKPLNFEEIRQALKAPRGSLSPSQVSEAAFTDFRKQNATDSEGTLMRTVVPHITGNISIPNEGNLPFNNLASITNDTTVNPVPDFYDGVYPSAIDKRVRDDLDKVIVPTKRPGIPIAPNFFLEAKAPSGSPRVAEMQAVLDGAYGAFAMHALQNYLVDEPVYDSNAYAFSTTLVDGTLKIFAHHLGERPRERPGEPPGERPGKRPHCYTTQVKAYVLSDEEMYLEGMGAFRNLRIRARDDRDRFIKLANERARQESRETQDGRSSADNLHGQVSAEAEDAGYDNGPQPRPKVPRSPPSPSSPRHPKTSRSHDPEPK